MSTRPARARSPPSILPRCCRRASLRSRRSRRSGSRTPSGTWSSATRIDPTLQPETEILGQFWQPDVALDKAAVDRLKAFIKKNRKSVILTAETKPAPGSYDLFGVQLQAPPPLKPGKGDGYTYQLDLNPDGSTADDLPVKLPSSMNVLQGTQEQAYVLLYGGLDTSLGLVDQGPTAAGSQGTATDGTGLIVVLSQIQPRSSSWCRRT